MKCYLRSDYQVGDTIEVEKTISYRYQSKTPRRENVAETSKYQKTVNERNAINNLRRVINHNFRNGDIHIVLTYSVKNRVSVEKSKVLLSKWLRDTRKHYKKNSSELKYISVTEYLNKALHHHLLINEIENVDSEELLIKLTELWGLGGVKFSFLYSAPDFGDLAEYFVKETKNTYNSDLPGAPKRRWNPSRNLEKPPVETKVIKASTWTKEPRAIKGYYIEKDSVIERECPFTGTPSQFYRMIRLTQSERYKPPRKGIQQGWIPMVEKETKE